MSFRVIILILLAIACNCAVRWQPNENLYFLGQGITFFLISVAGRWSTNNRLVAIFWDLFILMTINNVIDEAIFDPVKFGFNELLFGIISVLITTIRTVKCLKNGSKSSN